MTTKVVQEMIVQGRLDRVAKNSPQAGRMLRSCLQHLETADQRAGGDPAGSYVLLYDAARKAVAAHMLFHGLRVTSRPGAHAAIVTYAEAELGTIGGDHVVHLDRMRRRPRRALAPEAVDQPVDRDRLAEVEHESGEELPRLRSAELDDSPVSADLERSEETDVERFRLGHLRNYPLLPPVSTAWHVLSDF